VIGHHTTKEFILESRIIYTYTVILCVSVGKGLGCGDVVLSPGDRLFTPSRSREGLLVSFSQQQHT